MIKKLLLLFSITATLSMGIEESNIKSTMGNKTHTITSILQNNSLSRVQKEKKVFQIVHGVFDYSIMARISLGKTWKTLNTKQRKKFIATFKKKLQYSYFDKLELYTNQKVLIKNPIKLKSNRITIQSDIIGKDKIYKVIYKLYKEKSKDNWLIYDVNISGVSIVQSYRIQFSEFLKTKSFDQLLKSL